MNTEQRRLVQTDRERIARLIMGWHAAEIPWAYDGLTQLWHDADATPLLTVHAWRPDEDDEQCMQVLDRMLALGYRLQLTCDGDGCRAEFTRDTHSGGECRGADRRMVMLRAALVAVEKDS